MATAFAPGPCLTFCNVHPSEPGMVGMLAASGALDPLLRQHTRVWGRIKDKATGLWLWEYLPRVRLDQARQILSETERKVTDIAFSLGFGVPCHFAKVFGSRERQSPHAFRLKSRKTGRLS